LPQFAARHIGELIEHLHTDDPAVKEQEPRAFGTWIFRSHRIQEDIGVEKRAHPVRRRPRGELRSVHLASSRWLADSRSNFQPAGNFQLLFRRISSALSRPAVAIDGKLTCARNRNLDLIALFLRYTR
jgi:hypothetical protein